jgi:hypothetical protein
MEFQHLHRFIYFTKIAFKDVQKADYNVSVPFAYLKHHLNNFVQVAFFDDQDAENEFSWPFDSLKQSFVFTKVVPSGRLLVLRAIRLLKTSFRVFVQNSFFIVQDAENGLAWPFDISKHRLFEIKKVVFKSSRRQIMIYQDHSSN